MDQNRLDKIINLIRENMTVGAAGFTGAADPKGPVAGYDPVMKFDGRKKGVKKYINNLLKNREKREKKKQLKKLQNFNPYFNQ